MKRLFALSLILINFSLLLFANIGDARKNPAEYWKTIMKEEAMPESLRELIHEGEGDKAFVKDFDMKPNVIIYHGHGSSEAKENKHYGEEEEKDSESGSATASPKKDDQKKKLKTYVRS